MDRSGSDATGRREAVEAPLPGGGACRAAAPAGAKLGLALEQTEAMLALLERGEWEPLRRLALAREATVRAALAGPLALLSGAEREQVRRLAGEDARLAASACRLRDEIATRLAGLRRSRHGARQYERADQG